MAMVSCSACWPNANIVSVVFAFLIALVVVVVIVDLVVFVVLVTAQESTLVAMSLELGRRLAPLALLGAVRPHFAVLNATSISWEPWRTAVPHQAVPAEPKRVKIRILDRCEVGSRNAEMDYTWHCAMASPAMRRQHVTACAKRSSAILMLEASHAYAEPGGPPQRNMRLTEICPHAARAPSW